MGALSTKIMANIEEKLWLRTSHQTALKNLFKSLEGAGFKLEYAYEQEGERTEKNPSYEQALIQVTCAELGSVEFVKEGNVFALQIITFNDDITDNVPDWCWDKDCPQSIQNEFEALMNNWYDKHENY